MIIDESLMFWITRPWYRLRWEAIPSTPISFDMEGTANATLATGAYGHGAGGNIYFTVMLQFQSWRDFGGVPAGHLRCHHGSCCHVKPGALIPTVILDTTAILTSNVPANFVASGIIPLNGVKQYLQVNYIPVGLFTSAQSMRSCLKAHPRPTTSRSTQARLALSRLSHITVQRLPLCPYRRGQLYFWHYPIIES